ncbi:hypothetical protein [Streptomyces sp. 8N616]|uniref:hypothetical protein n=1 Tax=Streptomyces sp. 8N616 TaxID=3457414 RepID=UPI003FD607D3
MTAIGRLRRQAAGRGIAGRVLCRPGQIIRPRPLSQGLCRSLGLGLYLFRHALLQITHHGAGLLPRLTSHCPGLLYGGTGHLTSGLLGLTGGSRCLLCR